MTGRQVISHLQNLDKIGSGELGMLNELTEKYPWFSSAYTLRAKCLSNQNTYGFKQALKKAAIYAGNREVLYDVIHNHITFSNDESSIEALAEPVLVDEPAVEESLPDESAELTPSATEETLPETYEETAPQSEDLEVPNSEEEDDLLSQEIDIPETESASVPTEITDEETDTELPSTEPEQEEHETPVYDPLIELQSQIESPINVGGYDPEKALAHLIREDDDSAPVDEPPAPKERHNFLDWLESVSEEDEPNEPTPRRLPISEDAQRLLDNFIKNRPSIRKIRTTSNEELQTDLSERNDDESIVSESLARLYIKQGSPQKALDVYQKLQLQNPQKFSYFAALMEDLRSEHGL
ncbi:MAG: hypothetical protein H6608_04470 [Flavobacteriales bacterium]|nr:hypothetical protein [Flavobacteriales bacterium]